MQVTPSQRAALEAHLARVQLRNFPLPVQLGTEVRPEGHLYLTVDIEVLDRDGDGPSAFVFSFPIPPAALRPGRLFPFVRRKLLWVMTHEVDEALHVDGQRRWDPHAKPSPYTACTRP
jgi:hypothetical protein